MPTIELIDSEARLEALTYDWLQLNLPSTMQTPSWALAWWRAFSTPQDQLFVLAVYDGAGALVGLAPWYRRSSLTSGCSIRFLGDGKACSDFQTLLCRTDAESDVVEAIIDYLCGKGTNRPRWDLLDFDGISGSDLVMSSFMEQMAARGHVTHRRDTESTWRIALDGSWERFLARQSKTQRNQMRNFCNRFDKGNFQWRIASTDEARATEYVQIMMELHQKRWQAVGYPGCFAEADMRYFFSTVFEQFIASGHADVGVLFQAERPVAALAWMMRDNIVFGYQCGRDPELDSLRVGRIAQAMSIRWACQQGFSSLDFLRGDEGYKSQMRCDATACYRMRIVARASMPLLRHNLWLACRDVKNRFASRLNTRPLAHD